MARFEPGATPERALVDIDYLERLEAALGARALGELLADGMIELADRLVSLERAGRAGDRPAASALGHDIVAVAGHIGLGALSAAAAELCRGLREGLDGTAAHGAGAGGGGRRRSRGAPPAAETAALADLVAPVVEVGRPSLEALAGRTGRAAN